MMNMNDAMTVRQKLLTGFGLVLLLQLLMAVFAMNKMSAVQQNLENILDARYSKIVLVTRATESLPWPQTASGHTKPARLTTNLSLGLPTPTQ